ncbi:cellulase family glycosylhydrolase [Nonomuraea phyllanthi]|uniref:endo-1,4-beta-xylanase n=1 Tax=Nonomuraea phyllanthi TaxID=2219224 RepID=UPI00129393BF|nr:endo-1,4-beta-xylanase [Nonomuraea phyllanthi]QFY10875.1 cellulase family glycosylhydrolase [Nonomuraea phyllanthi]
MSVHSSLLLRALTVAGVLAAFLLPTTSADASAPLRTHAAARGKFIGAALATSPLSNENSYRTIAATEFNQVTAENAMKWDSTEPSQGQFNFSGADAIVNFATQNDMQVHGHTLVWHNQTPGWVQNLGASAMRTAMQNHISQVVGRYADNPAVVSWDVVNEAFEDNGNYRTSFWYNTLGQGYIADAFRAARAADPDARLCINDYNTEGINAKSTAIYNLVSSLRQQGVPVDCVGFQTHLAIQYGFPNDFQQNLERFAALGVQVRITELDVRMQMPRSSSKDATQATYYRNVVNACMAVTACAGVTIWGFTDKYSWVPDTFSGQGAALIYDENYQQKPSYTAVHDALAGGSSSDTTPPSTPGTPSASNVTSNSAQLSWTASTDTGGSGLAGYNVYREQGSNDQLLGQSSTNSITLTGLSASTQYQVYVRARDGAGNLSSNSSTGSFTTTEGNGGPGPGGTCTATPTVQTQWNGGYVVQPVTVTNTGSSGITGWTVTFTLPSGHTLVGSWNAAVTVSGQTVTAKNAAYNGTLAPNASTSFGFQVSRPNGNTQTPSGYTCA